MYGFSEFVSAILDSDDSEPNSENRHGRTSLWMAVDSGK